MKKLYSKLLTLVTIGFYSLSVWAQDAPVIQNYSDYTGDSFVANWDKVSGADKYFLNVYTNGTVSYTHLRAHETGRNLVCRLLLEKKKNKTKNNKKKKKHKHQKNKKTNTQT